MPMNYAKTGLLLAMLMAIFVAMGAVVGGKTGMVIAFVIALAMNAFSLWKSDTMVLKMFSAQAVDEKSAPVYFSLVRDLATRAELPMPRVYVLPTQQPNAFATGRSPERSAIAASTGLLNTLNNEELAGVIAHELAHIKNRDTLTMTVAATVGGAISMLAQYLQFSMLFGGHRGSRDSGVGWIGALIAMIAAPFAAMLVQMAISRSREYQADKLGAMICGNPLWLASALQRIQVAAKGQVNDAAESVPAAAHLFIINPLTGQGVDNWFSTHPNTHNRVAELEELAREMGVTTASPGQVSTSRRREQPVGDNSHQAGAPQASGPEPTGPWAKPPNRGPWS